MGDRNPHRISRRRSWTGCNAIHDAPSDEFILKLTRHFFSRLIGLSMPRLLPAVAVQIITNKIFFFAIFFFSAFLFPWGKKRGGQFQDKIIRGRVVYSVTTSRASSPAYSMVKVQKPSPDARIVGALLARAIFPSSSFLFFANSC